MYKKTEIALWAVQNELWFCLSEAQIRSDSSQGWLEQWGRNADLDVAPTLHLNLFRRGHTADERASLNNTAALQEHRLQIGRQSPVLIEQIMKVSLKHVNWRSHFDKWSDSTAGCDGQTEWQNERKGSETPESRRERLLKRTVTALKG